jgi:hypothetical protein
MLDNFDVYPVSTIRECLALKAYLIDDQMDPVYVYPGETDRKVSEAGVKTLWWSFDLIHVEGKTSLLIPMHDPFKALVACLGIFSGVSDARLIEKEEVASDKYNAKVRVNGFDIEGVGNHMFLAIISAFLSFEKTFPFKLN